MSDIVIKDESGDILDHFYQWDMNRVISFHAVGMPSSFNVHYANKCSKQALVVNPDTSGEYPTAQVPNLILQNSDVLYIYIYDTANQVYKTEFTVMVPVVPRAKPSDHQYIENISYDTVAALRAEISSEYVHKDGSKVLSDNNFSNSYKDMLDYVPSGESILSTANKGAVNGVAPLNDYGVIPVEYIPGGGDEDIYLVNVAIALDRSPTTYDSEAVRDIPNHNNTFLRLTNGLNTNNAVFQYKYGGTYIFWCAFAVGADSYDIVTYNVDTGNGTIAVENIFTKPDDYIVSSGESNGWTYRKYASGVSECW